MTVRCLCPQGVLPGWACGTSPGAVTVRCLRDLGSCLAGMWDEPCLSLSSQGRPVATSEREGCRRRRVTLRRMAWFPARAGRNGSLASTQATATPSWLALCVGTVGTVPAPCKEGTARATRIRGPSVRQVMGAERAMTRVRETWPRGGESFPLPPLSRDSAVSPRQRCHGEASPHLVLGWSLLLGRVCSMLSSEAPRADCAGTAGGRRRAPLGT